MALGIDKHRRTVVVAAVRDSGEEVEPRTFGCRDVAGLLACARELKPFRRRADAGWVGKHAADNSPLMALFRQSQGLPPMPTPPSEANMLPVGPPPATVAQITKMLQQQGISVAPPAPAPSAELYQAAAGSLLGGKLLHSLGKSPAHPASGLATGFGALTGAVLSGYAANRGALALLKAVQRTDAD